MQAVILAAGEGKRMKPISDEVPKMMIPILDRPFLEYILLEIKDAGITDMVIVVSPKSRGPIESYFGDGSTLGLKINYAVQHERKGTAHAISKAQEFLKDEYFLVHYGDSLTETSLPKSLVENFKKNGEVDAYLTLREEKDTWRYGVVKFDGDRIKDIVEKPEKGKEPSNMVMVGVFILKRESFFRAIRDVEFVKGKEEFPAKYILKNNGKVKGWLFSGKRVDLGWPHDILNASRLLSRKLFNNDHYIGKNISIGENSVVKNSFVNSNAKIGENCILENSYVMGECSIGDGCEIIDSVIWRGVESGKKVKGEVVA